MPNANYCAGRRFEWETCHALRKMGAQAVRSAGSHGSWDITAVFPGVVLLVQVKRMKRGKTIPHEEYAGLIKLEAPPGVRKEVWVYRKAHGRRLLDRIVIP